MAKKIPDFLTQKANAAKKVVESTGNALKKGANNAAVQVGKMQNTMWISRR